MSYRPNLKTLSMKEQKHKLRLKKNFQFMKILNWTWPKCPMNRLNFTEGHSEFSSLVKLCGSTVQCSLILKGVRFVGFIELHKERKFTRETVGKVESMDA